MSLRTKISLFWGFLTFFGVCLLFPLLHGDKITFANLASGFVLFMGGGFIFGSLVRIKKGGKKQQQ